MKPIETYKCTDCKKEWGLEYATWETPECPDCKDNEYVIETTDIEVI